jgi:FkbM family methyltransferase
MSRVLWFASVWRVSSGWPPRAGRFVVRRLYRRAVVEPVLAVTHRLDTLIHEVTALRAELGRFQARQDALERVVETALANLDRGLPLPPDPQLTLPEEARRRAELTISCRDADSIPKVRDAGTVRVEKGIAIQVMHEGTRVLAGAYHGDWMREVIRRLRGHHEPQEELAVHKIIERLACERGDGPRTFIELGSFWAYYSIWALRRLGGTALLVEPDPSNLEIGRANLRVNGLQATLVNAAVGGEHGTTTGLTCESDGVERVLPVVTVPGLLAAHQVDVVDILFVDVQGPETDVLARSVDLLRERRIRFLVISTHHHRISGDPLTHQSCLATLIDAGAHVVAEHTVGESFSGDGLIVASTQPADRDLVVSISYARYGDSLFGSLEPELAAALDAHGPS